jgi:hypothetical protein
MRAELLNVRSAALVGCLLSVIPVVPSLTQQNSSIRLFRNPSELQPATPQKTPGQSLVISKAPSALAPQQDVT